MRPSGTLWSTRWWARASSSGSGRRRSSREQHADLGGEAQARPVEEGEERAPAERILRQQAALAVPEDEREGPVDALEQPLAPARVPGRQRLGHRGVRAQAELLAQGVGLLHAPRHARQHALGAGGLSAGQGQGARLDDGGARQRAPQPVALPADPSRVVDAGELAARACAAITPRAHPARSRRGPARQRRRPRMSRRRPRGPGRAGRCARPRRRTRAGAAGARGR